MSRFSDELHEKLKAKDPVIGKDRYLLTSVLLPLITIENRCHLVFQVRAEHIRQGGEVCFPGGKFDPLLDKNTKDTAMRETSEEMGITAKHLEYIGKLGHYIAPMGVLVDAHVARLKIDAVKAMNFNRDEVERIFTLPLSYFKHTAPELHEVNVKIDPYIMENGEKRILLPYEELGLPKRYEKSWGNMKHRIFVYKNDPVIWGITAELIQDFVKLL
jgi:8-oxo-dGTP pyrophosphatase MutT (NUDIX family)